MLTAIHRFWEDETGLTSVEYAILIALVVAIAVGAWNSLMSTRPALQTAQVASPASAVSMAEEIR